MGCKHHYEYMQGYFICRKCGDHRSYGTDYKRTSKATVFLGIIIVIVLVLIAVPAGMMFLSYNFDEGLEIEKEEQTKPEIESQDKKQSSDIIPKNFNLFDDGILTYKIDPIPSHIIQTSTVKDSVNDGLNLWSKKNPKLVFEEITTGKPDIEISWIEHTGTHAGMGCIDCLRYGATIELVLGQLDCNGEFIQYDMDMIKNTVAHEFGHNLGLEHHIDENHLMWSKDDPQIPYDTLDYNIPNRITGSFLGYKELLDKHELLSEELEELHKELDLLTAKFEQFPSQTRTQGEYQRALLAYNELSLATDNYNSKIEQSDQLVEELNCFAK